MADIRITDLVDEKVFDDLENLSRSIKEVKQQYIDAANALAKGLEMKISTPGDLDKFNRNVAESGRKAQEATEQLNNAIEKQRTIIGQTTNVISRELAEIEKENKAKREAFAQDKSALDIAESLIGTRDQNILRLSSLQTQLKSVKDAQKAYDDAVKSGTMSEEDAARKRATNLEQQRTLKAAIQDLNGVLNNQDKQMQAAEGSYQKLSLQLEFLKKAYKSLNEEEKNSDIGKQLAEEIGNMDAHLKDLAADMGEFQRNTGNYAIANQSVKKELRELVQELAQLTIEYRNMSEEERNSAKGQELEQKMNTMKERAFELKDAVADVSREIQSGANDTKSLNAITEGINVLVSGIGGLTAASHALGIGEKDLVKIQTTLQASLAASNALTKAQNALQKESSLMLGVRTIQEKAQAAAIRMKTVAEGESTAATVLATAAQRTFNAVARANPYVLLATGIGLLVAAVVGFTKATKSETEEQKKEREEMEKSRKEYEDMMDVTKRLQEAREKGIESCSDEIAKLQMLYTAATDTTRSYNERKLAVDKLQELYPKYFANLNDEIIMAGKAEAVYKDLATAIYESAMARSKEKILEEYLTVQIKKEEELQKTKEAQAAAQERLNKAQSAYNDNLGKLDAANVMYRRFTTGEQDIMREYGEANQQVKELNEKVATLTKETKDAEEAARRLSESISISDLYQNVGETPIVSHSSSSASKAEKEETAKTYEEIKEIILEYSQQIIAERIALTEEGSKEEYDLTIQYIKAEQELRLMEIQKAYEKEKKELDSSLALKKVTQEQYNDMLAQLDENRATQSVLAERKAEKAREDAMKKYSEAYITAMEDQYAKEQEARSLSLMQELTALTRQRSERMIGEEDYQRRVAEMQERYARETAEKQIEMLEKILESEQLTSEQREQISEQLKAAKIKAANDVANAELKSIKAAEKEEKDSTSKRTRTMRQYLQNVSRMMGQINSLVSSIYDGQLEKIDEEKDASEKAYEKEVEQIQNLEETGAISKEESEARKRAAEKRSAEHQEELDKKRQEVLYKQAVWQKATSIAQAGIATALAVTEALPNFILAALVAAMGAIEVATIIATPIAKYAKGTGKDGHPGGYAIVGDAGKNEAVVYGGRMWITPDTPTLVDMPKGAVVYPDADSIPEPVFMTVTPTGESKGPVVVVSHDSKKLERSVAQTNQLLKHSIYVQKRIAYDAAYANYKKTRL